MDWFEFHTLLFFIRKVEMMQETMENGGYQNTHRSQKDNSRIDCIKGSKDLPCIRMHWVDRPHAAKDHGGIKQGIDPGQVFKKMVADHANPQGKHQQQYPN